MRILLDHGMPAPLRKKLPGHLVSTAYEMGWAELDNGTLLTAADGSFDSGNMAKSQSYSKKFDTAGSYAYVCAYHPNMKATVIVTQ